MNLEEQYHAEEMLRKIERVKEDAEVSGLMASAKNRLHLQAKKIGELHQQLAAAQAEALEQARIVGMGGERELALRQQFKIVSELLREASGRMNYGHWSSEFRGRVEKSLKLKGY
ncbi:MAG: hypothetical protein IPJ48_16360 [Propionivibrio sp.]|uniref:Uncharacterized protein n=1 Tax=Candidatus Propionivibrio dominans TaxID=2954373 RepID=A0A9D7IHS0_9RHOO|nr:hypothetical protein [Candidatus Propionivibrio dominans]